MRGIVWRRGRGRRSRRRSTLPAGGFWWATSPLFALCLFRQVFLRDFHRGFFAIAIFCSPPVALVPGSSCGWELVQPTLFSPMSRGWGIDAGNPEAAGQFSGGRWNGAAGSEGAGQGTAATATDFQRVNFGPVRCMADAVDGALTSDLLFCEAAATRIDGRAAFLHCHNSRRRQRFFFSFLLPCSFSSFFFFFFLQLRADVGVRWVIVPPSCNTSRGPLTGYGSPRMRRKFCVWTHSSLFLSGDFFGS